MQERNGVSTIVKLAALTERLNGIAVADTQVMDLDEKVLDRPTRILDAAMSSRLLIHQVLKSERSYLKLRESMTTQVTTQERFRCERGVAPKVRC